MREREFPREYKVGVGLLGFLMLIIAIFSGIAYFVFLAFGGGLK